jgi:IclR family acetate operon transcriptional repressor
MTSAKSPTRASQYRVGSVARAIELVDLVAAAPPDGLTLSQITAVVDGSKSTIFALLRTLAEFDYVRFVEPGPRYLPGMALVRLGDLSISHQPIGQIARPILHSLSQLTELTIRVAINDDGHPVFIERIDSPGTVRFNTPLGVRELAHVSSAGKAILAQLTPDDVDRVTKESGFVARTKKTHTNLKSLNVDLAEIRKRGYAVDNEEDEEGVFCVGAAFFDHTGKCAGAVSATGIKVDLTTKKIDELGKLVKQHAMQLSKTLGAPTRSYS